MVSFAFLLLLFCFNCLATSPACQVMRAHAKRGVDSFEKLFMNEGFFSRWSNSSYPTASYWNTFVALDLVFDAYSLGLMNQSFFDVFIENFYHTMNNQGWGSMYYDDLDWAIEALAKGMSLVKNSTITSTFSKVLQALSASVSNAWDESCCGNVPGGVWWSTEQTYKAAASNVGTSAAMCRMYNVSGDKSWLNFAVKVCVVFLLKEAN